MQKREILVNQDKELSRGFAEQLRQAIRLSPASINEIAHRSRVDQSTLNKFVRGQRHNLRLDSFERICGVLGLYLSG